MASSNNCNLFPCKAFLKSGRLAPCLPGKKGLTALPEVDSSSKDEMKPRAGMVLGDGLKSSVKKLSTGAVGDPEAFLKSGRLAPCLPGKKGLTALPEVDSSSKDEMKPRAGMALGDGLKSSVKKLSTGAVGDPEAFLKSGRLAPRLPGKKGLTALPKVDSSSKDEMKPRAGRAKGLSSTQIMQNLNMGMDAKRIDVTSMVYTFQSNRNSSKRTRVAEAVLQACSKPRSPKQRKRRSQKTSRIEINHQVKEAPTECRMDESLLDRHCFVFKEEESNDKYYALNKTKGATVPRFQSLSMFATTDVGDEGAIFRPNPNTQPIFVKAPYNPELTSKCVQKRLVSALTKLEGIFPKQQRGKSRFVGHESHASSYITVGVHANRGGRGLIESKLSKLKKTEKTTLVRYVKQIEESFCQWMDWSVVFAGANMREIQKIPTLSSEDIKQPTTFFSAIAFGRNVFLAAHKDQDFGYSAVVAMTDEANPNRDEVLCYFVFPGLGQKVALRNQDILIFNPQVHHCVSKRVVETDVLCLSVYLKTAVVGKNDNNLPLTDLEECIVNFLASTS